MSSTGLFLEAKTDVRKPRPRRYDNAIIRPRGREHIPEGFPHYSTVTKHGHCMCLQECCQADSGCVCKYCPCRRGIPHEH